MLHFETWKIGLVAVIALLGLVFSFPNVLPSQTAETLPDWLPNQQINLGLDLQGGSHLLAEVEVDLVIDKYLETVVDDLRKQLRPRSGDRINYTELGHDSTGVSFVLADPNDRGGEAERPIHH